MDATTAAMIALLGSQNPIKEYYKGLPCMLGEGVGRIVAESDEGGWGEIGGVKMYSIPMFCSPHGTIIKTGVLKLSKITEEGMKLLIGYENDVWAKGDVPYNGLLPEFQAKPIHEIIKLIDSYWKFDGDQQPMSSWHDKQDLLKAVEEALQNKKD